MTAQERINQQRFNARRAHEAYTAQAATVHAQIETLKATLAAHAAREAQDPGNWGFAGDLSHANALLGELLDFFPQPGTLPTYATTDRKGRKIRVTIPEGE